MRTLLFATVTLLLASCTDYVSKDFKKFGNYEWQRADMQELTVEIPADSMTVDVLLHVRYANGFAYQNLNLIIEELTPDGESRIAPFSYRLRGDDGAHLGDGSGDIWDIRFPLKQNMLMQGGKYRYKIGHTMPQDKLLMLMEIGITVEASNK